MHSAFVLIENTVVEITLKIYFTLNKMFTVILPIFFIYEGITFVIFQKSIWMCAILIMHKYVLPKRVTILLNKVSQVNLM